MTTNKKTARIVGVLVTTQPHVISSLPAGGREIPAEQQQFERYLVTIQAKFSVGWVATVASNRFRFLDPTAAPPAL